MTRILLALVFILGAAGAITAGSTGAFFSDTESSTGNLFTAGAIDLKVDNESYYNLNKCALDPAGGGGYLWQGSAAYPVPGTPCTTSWGPSDLANGLLFFNFNDLKPDDEGEDTISLTVDNNDAYACMDMTLTSNDDTSSTEPELQTGDTPEDVNNTWDGELAQNLQMFWWADDGDNVYEAGETALTDGALTLYNLATTSAFSVALADPAHNVWSPNAPGALTGGQTYYIGKAWCFGNLTLDPVTQDGEGAIGTNGPQARGTGVACDGTGLGNLTQTDRATVDLAFRVVQARHNTDFSCGGDETRTAKITVTKYVHNSHGGDNIVSDFQLFVDNGTVTTPVTSGVATLVTPGNYLVAETGVSGYVGAYSGDCDMYGRVTLNAGDDKHCTIDNSDLPSNITLMSVVTGGPANPALFGFTIDGSPVPNNTSIAVTSNSAHTIDEIGYPGYHFVSMTGSPECPSILGGVATLNEGQAITCTITNAKD